jgi:arylsulfatase A-like enzyme
MMVMLRRSLLFAPLLPAQAQTPIVWIMAKSHGWHLGAIGTAGLRTPRLDQLAEQGTLHTRAYAAALDPASDAQLEASQPQATYTATLEALKKRPNSLRIHLDRAAAFANARGPIAEDAIELPPSLPDLPVVRAEWSRYLHYLQCLDALTGAALDAVEKAGLAEDTLVIYASVSGPDARRALHDAALHVPLILRGPGIAPNSRRTELVSLADLPKPTRREHLAFENGEGRTVFDGRFRCVRNRNTIAKPLPAGWEDCKTRFPQHWRWLTEPAAAEELYDHASDPYELHNIAADPAYRDQLTRLSRL